MYATRRTLARPPASHISWPPSFSQHTIIELSSPFGLGSDMLSVVFDYIGMKKVGDNPHLLTMGDGRLFRPQFSFRILYVL